MGRNELTRLLAVLGVVALASALLGGCGDSGPTTGPEQFRDQTTSPLLAFGEEGDESELEEADEIVGDFLVARAKEDWEATCAALSRPILDKLEHLATSSTGLEDTSCPSFLDAFVVIPPREKKGTAEIEGGSLRRKGATGYLIYSGPGDDVYAMPLDRQEGEWRVAELSPKRLS